MIAHRVTDAVVDHPFCQRMVHHARKRHCDRGVADDALDPGPEAQHGLESRIGREIGKPGGRRIDHIVYPVRVVRHFWPKDLGLDPGARQGCGQNLAIVLPVSIGRGEQDPRHLLRGLWMCADCTSPKAASRTSIADPP